MTRSSPIKTDVKLHTDFIASSEKKPTRRKKRPAPLSLRLSPDEREQLEHMAGNIPISTYIKGRLFAANDNTPPDMHDYTPVTEKQLLAKILGMLARMEIFLTIKGLLKIMESGQATLKPETEDALQAACNDISAIRRDLIKAQGIKAE